MKHPWFLILLAFGPLRGLSAPPPFDWVRQYGDTNFQSAGGVWVSPGGSVYAGGYFNSKGYVLAKYNSAGELQWARSCGFVHTRSVAAAFDDAENLYLVGKFSLTVQFDTFVLTGNTNDERVFTVKFDPAGHVPWAQSEAIADEEFLPAITYVGGAVYTAAAFVSAIDHSVVKVRKLNPLGQSVWSQDAILSDLQTMNVFDLEVDPNSNVYVCGNIRGPNAYTNYFYLAKIDPNGVEGWRLTATGSEFDDGRTRLALDADGSVYVAGDSSSTNTWGTNAFSGVFLAKFSSTGGVVWAKSFPGSFNDLAQDRDGNLLVAGDFAQDISIGTNAFVCRGASDFFLVKYTRDGTVLWARQGGGTSWDHSPAVEVDSDGNAYLTGFFIDTVRFDPLTLVSAGQTDLFVTKYSREGVLLWALRMGGVDYEYPGSSSAETDVGWAVDRSGNVHVIAEFWQTTSVGTNVLTSAGNTDVFIARLAADPLLRFAPLVRNGSALSIQLLGVAGRTPVVVQDSPDLCSWTGIHTQAVAVESFSINDPLPGSPARFYRAFIP